MGDKAGALLMIGAVVGIGAILVAKAQQKPSEPIPEVPKIVEGFKYICRYGDGFGTDSEQEIVEHYRTVHNEVVQVVKIEWQ